MRYLEEKIAAGVITLSNFTQSQLIDLCAQSESQRDRDILGHEIMYSGGQRGEKTE